MTSNLPSEALLNIIRQLPLAQIQNLQEEIEHIVQEKKSTQSIIRDWIFSDEILLDDYQLVENEKRFNL